MIGVRYVSAAKNPSGYGNAARQFITALFIAGVNVTCETISQMSENTDYGITGKIRESLEERDIEYKVNIIHLTPDLYPDYKEKGKYIVGHLFFETNKLPREWIEPCNEIDELWVGSEKQAEMIKNSGVTTPCYVFAQPIDITLAYENIQPFEIDKPRDFTFYSCFQWILRKNPRGLLEAYWKEFEGDDKVTLLIKTYRITYTKEEYQLIKNEIAQWKKELGLKHYPKIYLSHQVLTERDMMRFHKIGDVFINPSSGEGWNRVMQEAMLLGKSTITTDNGGITDLMTSRYYHKVESHEVQAKISPSIPWYTSYMKWWELDETSLRTNMRNLYENKDTKASLAQQFIIDNFSYQKVGEAMKKRLEFILRI